MFYLTESVEIQEAIAKLSLHQVLWVDTETAFWNTPKPQLSLIQVLADGNDKTGEGSYILDVFQQPELIEEFITKIMANPSIEKVFHNAPYDLKFLGLDQAQNITCTLKQAKKITRQRLEVPNLQLKTLAAELCDFPAEEIDRQQQESDWSVRPLTKEQLVYASMDVIYLAHVHCYLTKFMGNILDTLMDFFTQEGWSFKKHPDSPVLLMKIKGKNGTWNCTATVREEKEYFIFHSLCPVKVLPEQYETMAEFLMTINNKVLIGNFEMNLDNGSIRYKTSIKVKGDRLSPPLIKELVYKNIKTMDAYLPRIQAVSEGLLSVTG